MFTAIKNFGISKAIVATVVGGYLGLQLFNHMTYEPPKIGPRHSNYNMALANEGFPYRHVTDEDYSKFVKAQLEERGLKPQPGQLNKPRVWIIDVAGSFSINSAEVFAEKIDYLWANARTGDHLVLKVNSTGGSIGGCGNYSYQVEDIKEKIGLKVTSVVDYDAGSCGYWVATTSDYIVASKAATIGNIGTVLHVPDNDLKQAVIDGIRHYTGTGYETYASTPGKEAAVTMRPTTPEMEQALVERNQSNYRKFVKVVMKFRGEKIKPEDIEKVLSGQSFSAEEALELGLIDKVQHSRSFFRELQSMSFEMRYVSYYGGERPFTLRQLIGF